VAVDYFSQFPKLNYFNTIVPNITLRTAFINKLKQDASVFYPYVIEDGERADTIATWYYGRPDFDWMIYLANDIVDPHTQWPKSYVQFTDYIIKKYGSIEQAQANIEFYRRKPDVSYISPDGTNFSPTPVAGMDAIVTNTDIRITVESYNNIDDQVNYYPVYSYDYELELNDDKKNINLIDNKLKNQVLAEMSALLNG
jgi:Base plate wedge protein 53